MVSQVAFPCETVDLQERIVDAVCDSSVGGLGIGFQVQNDFPSACGQCYSIVLRTLGTAEKFDARLIFVLVA